MPPQDWNLEEVEVVISDYLEMLYLERSGLEYNKSEHNRTLQQLTGRSHGSIEFKHANISAVLIELGWPYIKGYQPRGNYQDLLRVCLEERLKYSSKLVEVIEKEVISPATESTVVDFDLMQVDVPIGNSENTGNIYEKPRSQKTTSQKNYLEMEAKNHSLGMAGEELILKFEHARLWKAGQRALAERIEHISQTKGDGFGYDILSYEVNGQERFLEVKTTRYGSLTPFFATKNEVETSESCKTSYHLCRLFDFEKSPRFYCLSGALRDTCSLEAANFRVSPR